MVVRMDEQRSLLDGDVDGWSEGVAARDLAGSVDPNAPLMEGWGEYDDEDGGPFYFYNDETGEVRYSAPTGQLDGCLAYLRDRVGVPRDMGAAAAMWLRATLNWAVDVARKHVEAAARAVPPGLTHSRPNIAPATAERRRFYTVEGLPSVTVRDRPSRRSASTVALAALNENQDRAGTHARWLAAKEADDR